MQASLWIFWLISDNQYPLTVLFPKILPVCIRYTAIMAVVGYKNTHTKWYAYFFIIAL